MNITLEFTITYEEWLEAYRTYRARVRKVTQRSWRSLLGGIAVGFAAVLLLILGSVRKVPDLPAGSPAQYMVDLMIPISAAPYVGLALVWWFYMKRSSKSFQKIIWPVLILMLLGAAFGAWSGYIAGDAPPSPPQSEIEQ